MKRMKKWLTHTFNYSDASASEFDSFTQDLKTCMEENLPEKSEIVDWKQGFFFVHGFIKRNGKFVYFSIPDVRDNGENNWYSNVLIRTAQNEKDLLGGPNEFTTLKDFREQVYKLLRQ